MGSEKFGPSPMRLGQFYVAPSEPYIQRSQALEQEPSILPGRHLLQQLALQFHAPMSVRHRGNRECHISANK